MTNENSLWQDLKVGLAFGLGFVGMATGVVVASLGSSGGYFEAVGLAVVGLLIIGASAVLSMRTVGRLGTGVEGAQR